MAALGFLTSLFDQPPQQPQQAPMVVALDEVKRRRERAQKSYDKATDTSPILSGWQGLARVAEGINGAIDDYVARRDERAGREAGQKAFLETLGGGAAADATSSPPAGAPAAAKPANLGAANDVENSFVDGVRQAGLTNPIGLGAVAATGKAESGYSPQNVNRTWSDPSQSGQPGTAGGIMSWRADRLQNLQRFAAERGEQAGNISPATQAAFFASEDPTLIPRLNAAKSPDEANRIMANAWRFAGYDQPGGETARRLALTQAYAQRFGGQGGPAPAIPVQVAENEADVRRLEAQQGNPVVDAPARAAPTQVAQADAPAPGATEAQGFAIPGQPATSGVTGLPLSGSKAVALMSSPTYEYLPAGRKAVVQAMAQRAIAQSAKDPLEREKMVLEIAKMRSDAANAPLARKQQELAIQKSERELQGEGATPLTPEERQSIGIPDGQAAYKTRNGEIKFGPAGTKIEMPKAQGEEEKQRGQGIGKRMNDIAEEGTKAAEDAALYQRFTDLLGTVQTGNKTATLEKIRQMTNGAITLDPNTDNVQALNAVIQYIAPRLRVPGSGAQSDRELGNFLASIPSLAGTPGGNQKIIETLAGAVEYKKRRAAIAQQWQLGDLSAKDAQKQIDDLPAPWAPQPKTGGPAVGAVEGGYRFKGGNAGDPSSWEKVQ